MLRKLFVKIGLDSGDSENRIKKISDEVDRAASEFKKMGAVSTTSLKNTEKAFYELGRAALGSEPSKELQALARTAGVSEKAVEQLIKKTREDMKLDEQFKEAASAMGLTEVEINKVKSSIDRAKESSASWKNVMSGLASVGLTAGILAIGQNSIKIGASFESEMSQVRAATNSSVEDLKILSNEARRLGASSTFSATEAAQAMTELGKAGFDTNKLLSGTSGVLDLAAAGGLNLAEAASIASDTMSGFGLVAEDIGRIADVLSKGANSSTISVGMMGETFKYVSGVAKAANVSLEETAAMTAILGNAGIKGSMAGTTLKAMLLRLASPSREAANALGQLGVKVVDSRGQIRKISEIIGELQKSTSKLGNQEKLDYLSTIFGAEPAAGMVALLDQGKLGIEQMTKLMVDAKGSAKAFADIANDNLAGKWKAFSSIIEEIQLKFYDLVGPILKSILGFFADTDKGMSRTSIALSSLAIILGVILVKSTLAWAASLDVVTLSAIKAYAALILPAILLAAKLTVLYLILEDIWVFFEYGPTASETYFADLLKWLGVTVSELEGMHEAFKVFKNTLAEFADKIKLAFQNETFRNIVKWIFIIVGAVLFWKIALITGVIYAIMYIVAKWDFLMLKLKEGFLWLANFLVKTAKTIAKLLVIAIFPLAALYFFREEIKTVFETISNYISNLPFVKNLLNQFFSLKDKLASIFSGMWESLKATFGKLLPTDTINTIIDSINWISQKLNQFSSGKVATSLGMTALNLPIIPRIEGARAEGGPVSAGKLYRVNERGEEYFEPSQNGYIHPTSRTNQSGNGSVTNHFSFAITIQGSKPDYDAYTLFEKFKEFINSENSKSTQRYEVGLSNV